MPLDLFYAAIGLQAFVLALVLVPVARRFGERFGFMDAPDPRKIHSTPKVRCGGLGIFLAFACALCANLLLARYLKDSSLVPDALRAYLGNIPFTGKRLGALMLGATIIFITGLVDDRRNLRPGIKLALQIASALPLVFAGVTVRCFIPGEIPGALLTIAWVVMLTNSFNFLDNMNGLSSGVAALCGLNFYLISRAGGEFFMMAIFALFIGAVCGFLRYNFPDARLFMGDSGSLFIGYMLAGLSTMVTYYESGVPTQLPVVAPLIILGVPIFDTASVLYIRWRNGAPLMKGDRNHFSHRLVALGFPPTRAVLFIYLVTFTIGITAVNLRWLNWSGAVLALLQAALFFVVIYFLERTAQKEAANNREQNGK
jgi:UDP-GlcNAc:undecaprenyl-phosphate GlcNAc-1-phosphate transferase